VVSNKKRLVFLLALTMAAFVQAFWLWRLPYTTSKIFHLPLASTEQSQVSADVFRLGELTWNMNLYKKDEKLKAFREFFKKHCGDQNGLAAATCLSDILLAKIPFGAPAKEAVDHNYSPRQAFEAHMSGAPGHCVTYAGLSSLVLLASGIPARMVQIVPTNKSGHNVIEVWDVQHGWIIFDPLNKVVMVRDGKPVSAIESLKHPKELRAVKTGGEAEKTGYLNDYYQGALPFDGAIVYPEPWLYTRTGDYVNGWLYRGQFMTLGANFFALGRAQELLRYGIFICLACAGVAAVFLVRPGWHWWCRKAKYLRLRVATVSQK
jgi:hypothetical protein